MKLEEVLTNVDTAIQALADITIDHVDDVSVLIKSAYAMGILRGIADKDLSGYPQYILPTSQPAQDDRITAGPTVRY